MGRDDYTDNLKWRYEKCQESRYISSGIDRGRQWNICRWSKKQKGWSITMLTDTVGISFSWNLSAGERKARAGEDF